MRQVLGRLLLRIGARLCLVTEEDKQHFKDKINADTWFGSFISTGNHLIGKVSPMNTYDTQSVINVLLHKNPNYNRVVTREGHYYEDTWLPESQHSTRKAV